jgi:hypothetical protein
MPLPTISTPPQDLAKWGEWWDFHYQDHLEIQQAIQAKGDGNLTIYIITPWNTHDADGILGRHQQFHDDLNEALGLEGQDLSALNPKDPQDVLRWTYANFTEHAAARQALGI